MVGRVVRLALAAVGLYFVWPSLVEVFGSYDELTAIRPWWFAVMALLELASFVCVWLLIGISTASSHWFLIATSQLVGNSVSSVVPGGAAAGGPLQYTYMVRGGEEPARTASGLVAASLLTTTALFGLAALCVPLTLPAPEHRRPSRARGVARGRSVRVPCVLGVRRVHDGRTAPHVRRAPRNGC